MPSSGQSGRRRLDSRPVGFEVRSSSEPRGGGGSGLIWIGVWFGLGLDWIGLDWIGLGFGFGFGIWIGFGV